MIAAGSKGRRRGFVAALLIVVLFALTLLGGGLLRVVWLRHSDLRGAERRLQAEWLAESALDRARARLASDLSYTGETWSVSAEQLGGREAGSVRIDVRAVPGHADRRTIHARADYPTSESRRTRQSRETTIAIPDRKGDPLR